MSQHQEPSSPTKRERREAARAERLERERAAQASETRRKRLITLGAVLAAAVVIVVVAIAVSSGGSKNASSGGNVKDANRINKLFAGIPQNGITLGNANAPATIVEFADPQCPFCKEFAHSELPKIVEQYVRTGKAKMELRLLTFIGPDSVTGARALGAAGLQNKMWTATDVFYANQGEENSGYVNEKFLRDVLGAVDGLNVDQAINDMSNPKVSAQIGAAKTLASRYGVDSTPTLLAGPTGGTLKKASDQTAAAVGQLVEAAAQGKQ